MLLEIEKLTGMAGGPFSLRLAEGECIVISGPSGTGKSLLLRMIADLDENEGIVRLRGSLRESMTAPLWRRQVLYVAAESGWWAPTVSAHMQNREEASALLPLLGLPDKLYEAPIAQLSSGERQRLALIRAVIRRPRVMLLDEPTSALDEVSASRVEALLTALRQNGTGFIVVTHNEAQASRVATQRFEMRDKRLHEIAL